MNWGPTLQNIIDVVRIESYALLIIQRTVVFGIVGDSVLRNHYWGIVVVVLDPVQYLSHSPRNLE